jgi:uncharacterized membrane protein YphA (DoxX/SURF4 family)
MKDKIPLVILRVGVGLVFLAFGIGKFQNDYLARTLQSMGLFQALPWDVHISTNLIGLLELFTGFLLMLGWFGHLAAGLAVAQLTVILFLFGFSEIRDLGLLGAAVCLFLTDDKTLSLDWFLAKRRITRH